MAYNSQSLITVQKILDKVRVLGDIEPVFNKGGYSTEPITTICTDVFAEIVAMNFPHKWNRKQLPFFYSGSYQQDYALVNPDGSSVTNIEWLEDSVAFDINNPSLPKGGVPVSVGRSLPRRSGSFGSSSSAAFGGAGGGYDGFVINSYPNASLYYGTWGQTNAGGSTMGNNPVAGSIYLPQLSSGGNQQPNNPITQIIDANGNYLVLTTYGHEGTTAPVAASNATPGTTASGSGATTVWTVVDPAGMGIRILGVPGQTGILWQFNIYGQMTAKQFSGLGDTISPLPDKYEPFFRQGVIAQSYRYSPETKVRAKFKDEWQLWKQGLVMFRELEDREEEEYSFVPERTVMGSAFGGVNRNSWATNGNPFGSY